MMKEIYSSRLEFITPAFLAGANQNSPEIRTASIRGELRWWFRALGGTHDEEAEVFGSVHNAVRASALVVRVTDVKILPGQAITFSPMSNKGYLYYFAKASGKDVGIHRTATNSYLPAGSSFRMNAYLRLKLSAEVEETLLQAIEAFVRLGAFGLRSTRGCGSLAEEKQLSFDAFKQWTESLPESIVVRKLDDKIDTEADISQEAMIGFLRKFRKDNRLSGKVESSLGYSNGNKRESSALHIRPVKVKEGVLSVLVYTDAASNQRSLETLIKYATQSL